MNSADVLGENFGRIRGLVHGIVDGLRPAELTYRVDSEANTIGWLVWHLTRVQDDHIADVARTQQVWHSGDWQARFGLPFDASATGYGQRVEDVAAVAVSGELLAEYYDAVHEQTMSYLKGLRDGDLDRVVDEAWDPPVTLGVRLVSVIGDDLQHAGQAAFLRGVVMRAR